MNTTYFKYLFKRYLFFYIILTILYFLMFVLVSSFINNSNKQALYKLLYFPTTLFMILAYVTPLLSHRMYYSQTSANIYFSLPDRRVNIYRTSIYFHFLMNVLIFLVTIYLGILILVIKQVDYNYLSLFLYSLLMVIVFMGTYCFSAFIVSKTKNIIDALIINVSYIVLPALILMALYLVFKINSDVISWRDISFIGQADKTTAYFAEVAIFDSGITLAKPFQYLIIFIFSIICHLGSLSAVRKLKPETIGERTTSLFAYKSIIPLYCFFILIVANFETGITFVVVLIFLIICYVTFTLISKRSLKFDYKILIIFLVILISSNLLVYFLGR